MQHYRYNNYHNQKRQLVGHQPGVAAPAWKVNQQARKASASQLPPGGKILLSRLPIDVGEEEVEALFTKTVGPVKESFIVYNSQGNSKGMAIVSFHRKEDAMLARIKYNGKIIDGRRPIKIEIIKDEDDKAQAPAPVAPRAPPSLLQRLAPAPAQPAPAPIVPAPSAQTQQKKPAVATRIAAAANPRIPKRQKKGPKRLKKVASSKAQLDQEMEEYRARA